MTNNYLNIPYDKAKTFLEGLPEDKLECVFDQYNISESLDFTKIAQLAEYISDADLIGLGYIEEVTPSPTSFVSLLPSEEDFSVEEVIDFLNSLDDYELVDIYNKYDTHNLEDIAIAITDSELEQLGMFDEELEDEIFEESEDEFEYYDEYCEELDFLEDIPSDIPYGIVDECDAIFVVNNDVDFERFRANLDPNLVESCDKIDYDFGSDVVVFKVVPKYYPEEVSEDVVISKELNPLIFDNEHKMKEDVKQQILDYVQGFVNLMNTKDIDVSYEDLQLVGSNAGYLYTPESDIDIHFIWSYPMDPDKFEQMRAEFTDYVLSNPLFIGDTNAVELNLEDGFNMEANSARRYSLINDTWVNDSDDKEVYTESDMTKVEGYEEIVDEYSAKIDDVVDNDLYPDAVELKQEIRNNRSEDLKNYGSLSMGNVVFKELRNNGQFGKLRNYIKEKEENVINE